MAKVDVASPQSRFVREQVLSPRSGGRWFMARDTDSGERVLAVEVALDPRERTVLELSSDAFSAWPAFAAPSAQLPTDHDTVLIAYPEPSAE